MIKIPVVIFLIVLTTSFVLFTVFSQFRMERNPIQEYIQQEGSTFTAFSHWFTGFIAGRNFEFGIKTFIAGKGTFSKHAFSTFKLIGAAFLIDFILSALIIFWRKNHWRQENSVASLLNIISSIHALILLILLRILFGQASTSFWVLVFIIAITNNMFKEFYGDFSAEIDRIYNERYIQRGLAWGQSALKYGQREIIISLSRLFCSKLPLFLSSSFIIEYWSSEDSGLALDMLRSIEFQDYFLLLSITATFITFISFFYQIGRLPRFLDPRIRG